MFTDLIENVAQDNNIKMSNDFIFLLGVSNEKQVKIR